jgi:transposase
VASATREDHPVPAPHPPEFRRRAVELARQGDQTIRAIAGQLSISESCLRNWVNQADTDDAAATGGSNGAAGSGSPRLSSDEKRELAELRREKRRLEVENEILKRAAAYFARENILPK